MRRKTKRDKTENNKAICLKQEGVHRSQIKTRFQCRSGQQS